MRAAAQKRLQRWRALREEIRGDLLARGFNTRVGAFTQSYGSEALDASVLLIPHMGFLAADDPRTLSTVAAIEKGLTRGRHVRGPAEAMQRRRRHAPMMPSPHVIDERLAADGRR